MKTEIVKIPGKGVCILISDIDLNDLYNNTSELPIIGQSLFGPFSNIHVIADNIRDGRYIAAIKNIREQTGWSLREAKNYIDKFKSNESNLLDAEKFIKAHTIELDDFIGADEFKQ